MTEAKRSQTRRRVIKIVVVAAVVLLGLFVFSLVSGDGDDDDVAVGEEESAATTESTAPPTTEPPVGPAGQEVLDRDPPDPAPPPGELEAGALEQETLIEGEGEGAAVGDTVTVHYIGKTADGNVFDQSWERGQPFTVALGQGQVIPGWDQGLVGAKVGERRRLEIGADNAYGEQGSPPAIPPNAPLAFEVDIVAIGPGADGGGAGGGGDASSGSDSG